MKTIKKIDLILNKIEGAILIALLLIMLVMAFGQVVLRNFFSGGIVWGDILLRHLVLWIGFLGAALATSGERHLNIDVLTRYLPERLKGAVATIADIFAAIVCYLLFRASLTFMEFEVASKHMVYGEIPSWFAEIIIPAGYCLLMFHFSIRAILDADKALRKEKSA
jgi:TRAP-type C4-dicarboxylate transport system permease small subunit